MKKHSFLFWLFIVLNFLFFCPTRAQVFSESPVTISDKGEILSDMIYVKIRSGGFVEIPVGGKSVAGNSISNKFSNIHKTISDFCTNRQLNLLDIKVSKAIPTARDEDTLFTDITTGEFRKLPNLARVYIISFPKQVDIETIISELKKHAEVEYAHGPVQLVNCAEYPNDQYYSNGGQWYLNTINAPNAWGITKGSPDVKIALIEKDGVELSHSDLQSKIAGGDNNPAGILYGHGTWVAGFAGAVTNNNAGVASLGWNVKLLTYQPHNNDINLNSTAQKIKDAADAGANIINLSFKTIKTDFTSCSLLLKSSGNSNLTLAYTYYYNWDYSLVRDAITYAVGKNSIVVASAGNTNNPIGVYQPCESIPYPCYPAQYSNVIAVSASQQNNNFVDEWNHGSFVAVNAPGRTDAYTGLWSTDLNNSYTNDVTKTSGTSFSAPQVSALAALIKSINTSLTPSQIKTILENSADKVGQYSYTNGRNDYFGYGRINAYAALKYTIEHYGGTLNGNVTINDDLTIDAGKTLTVLPSTTVKFASGKSITINGTLNATTATFTGTLSSSYWGGIRFNSGSSGNLNGCTINNVQTYGGAAISIYYASPTIQNCTINNNTSGTSGVYFYYTSSPYLYNNTIQGSGYYGLYFNDANAYLRHNTISATGNYAAVYCYDHSTPLFAEPSGPSWTGNNTLQSSYYGINASVYSTPAIGRALPDATYNNRVVSNITSAYAGSGSTIYAQQVYWNPSPPTGIVQDGGTVYYNNPLPNDPGMSIVPSDKDHIYTHTVQSITDDEILQRAHELLLKGNFNDAVSVYKNIINSKASKRTAEIAIVELGNIFKSNKDQTILDFIRSLAVDKNDQLGLKPAAMSTLGHIYSTSGDFTNALPVYQSMIDSYPGTVHEASGRINLVYLYTSTGIFDLAKEALTIVKEKFPNDENILPAQWFLSLNTNTTDQLIGNSFQQYAANTDYKPSSNSVLLNNYPNPFNPTTKISFSLPQKSQIKLKVFDVLGREIQVLAEGIYEVGKYEVEFNASSLPSGVYFYNLTSGTNSITKKMLLIK